MNLRGDSNESDDNLALRAILEGTAAETGEHFFHALVRNLSRATGWRDCWITEYVEEQDLLKTLAFWSDGVVNPGFRSYPLAGTPCEPVVRQRALVHFPKHVQSEFPQDQGLKTIGAESYLGVPLTDTDTENRVLGHLAMIHDQPSASEPRGIAIFKIFAARAAAELRRMRSEAALGEIEQQLSSVFDGALDAIVTVNGELEIVLVNAAARRLFNCSESDLLKRGLAAFVDQTDVQRLKQLMRDLANHVRADPYLWVPGQIAAHCAAGRAFPAEATLSQCELGGQPHFTIILRDIASRLEAQKQIQELADRAQYLEEEIRALQSADDILGESPALQRVLDDVRQVAGTDASVLVLGETGTGKDLFARAIHDTSVRADKPLVKVNCAALPGALIESELFGHEKRCFHRRDRQARRPFRTGGWWHDFS